MALGPMRTIGPLDGNEHKMHGEESDNRLTIFFMFAELLKVAVASDTLKKDGPA